MGCEMISVTYLSFFEKEMIDAEVSWLSFKVPDLILLQVELKIKEFAYF